jgi:hypothetical protein
VASVTDNGIGDWTVILATDFASANYGNGAFGGFNAPNGALVYNSLAVAAGTFQINAIQAENGVTKRDPDTPGTISADFFGDHA